MTAELEPVAWTQPSQLDLVKELGNDVSGHIWGKRDVQEVRDFYGDTIDDIPDDIPLVTLSSAQEAIDKREERIRELERLLRAETFRADTNDKFMKDHFDASTAKGVEIQNLKAYIAKMTKEVAETIEQMRKRDVSVEQRSRAEAAEARVKELEVIIRGHMDNNDELATAWAAERDRATALQTLLDEVVTAWEALPGGEQSVRAVERWLASDMKPVIDKLRAARSLAAKIKEAKG